MDVIGLSCGHWVCDCCIINLTADMESISEADIHTCGEVGCNFESPLYLLVANDKSEDYNECSFRYSIFWKDYLKVDYGPFSEELDETCSESRNFIPREELQSYQNSTMRARDINIWYTKLKENLNSYAAVDSSGGVQGMLCGDDSALDSSGGVQGMLCGDDPALDSSGRVQGMLCGDDPALDSSGGVQGMLCGDGPALDSSGRVQGMLCGDDPALDSSGGVQGMLCGDDAALDSSGGDDNGGGLGLVEDDVSAELNDSNKIFKMFIIFSHSDSFDYRSSSIEKGYDGIHFMKTFGDVQVRIVPKNQKQFAEVINAASKSGYFII